MKPLNILLFAGLVTAAAINKRGPPNGPDPVSSHKDHVDDIIGGPWGPPAKSIMGAENTANDGVVEPWGPSAKTIA